jgi:hypothetical protein
MSTLAQRLDDGIAFCQTAFTQLRTDISKMDLFLPSQRLQLDSEIDQRIATVDTRLTAMTSALRRVPANSREYFEGEVESLRTEFSALQREVTEKRKAAHANPSVRQAEGDLARVRKAQGVSSDLDEAVRLGRENVRVQNVTMQTLLDDRDHLNHIDENLSDIDGEATVGTATAKRMKRRAF